MARPKSRKVWKRFRSSFHSRKALQQLTATATTKADGVDYRDDYDELHTEINVAKNWGFLRGVKRLCLGLGGDDNDANGGLERGQSFLETKWEEEVIRKRRACLFCGRVGLYWFRQGTDLLMNR